MKIFIVPGAPLDGSIYLEEVLITFAPPCVERLPLDAALAQADAARDLLILPHGSQSKGIGDFLKSGGHVIAIRPRDSIAALASLKSAGERQTPGRLRIVAPLCAAARGESLWTLGAQTIYESELSIEERNASTPAYLFEPNDPDSESIGIFERGVGEGVLTVFAYDPATCIRLLRQGLPERAGVLPPGECVPRTTYLHAPDAPRDTHWRPTADLHALALCDVVKNLLARRAPVPALWHIPAGKSAILLFTGDEDGAPQSANRHEMDDLEACAGAMSLYVIPGSTAITKDDIAEYTRRGHEVSVHPNLTQAYGQSKDAQLRRAESEVAHFREEFGQPVETVRNHSVAWPGTVELLELWEKLGIGMDANCLASLLFQSPDWAPYVHLNAALPLRFVREDGTLIDVYQQPTHISDDLSSHPTHGYSQKFSAGQYDWIVKRILEEAARVFHAPHCPIIHPGNYVAYSGEAGRSYMNRARDLDLPIWPLDRWHRFWRARAAWRMSEYSWRASVMSFVLSGPPCEGLYLTLPSEWEGRALSTLSLGDAPEKFEIVERFCRPLAQAILPAAAQEVRVVAEYSRTEI